MKYRVRRAAEPETDGYRYWVVQYGKRHFASRISDNLGLSREIIQQWLLDEAPHVFAEQVAQLRRRAETDEHAADCLEWYEAGLFEGGA